ncbi:type VI secretion system baseplate protein IglJ [uncultured Shewanella sp.]|uniref:type VI secretion system baseplate protein IglJ n=1 Tax=uncultured Shewanella sp. TaxID=173975 RepID=UPI00260178CC|nr:type VI secretion system baseplate protein IglJ [uncultured Shewanella sp.]
MDKYSSLSAFLTLIKESNISINMNQLLRVIEDYDIESENVNFEPIFSIIPENTLINDIIIAENQVHIHVNLFKINIFHDVIHIYYNAERNNQYRVLDITLKSCSKFMHHYFYGISFSCKSHYLNQFLYDNNLYGLHETVLNSISILCTSLKIQLSDFNSIFYIENENDVLHNKMYMTHLGTDSILDYSHITGKNAIQKAVIKIQISLDNYSEKNIDIIKSIICKNIFLKKISYIVSVRLYVSYHDESNLGFLNFSEIGKNTLSKCFEVNW